MAQKVGYAQMYLKLPVKLESLTSWIQKLKGRFADVCWRKKTKEDGRDHYSDGDIFLKYVCDGNVLRRFVVSITDFEKAGCNIRRQGCRHLFVKFSDKDKGFDLQKQQDHCQRILVSIRDGVIGDELVVDMTPDRIMMCDRMVGSVETLSIEHARQKFGVSPMPPVGFGLFYKERRTMPADVTNKKDVQAANDTLQIFDQRAPVVRIGTQWSHMSLVLFRTPGR
jgi:hypothetical protein